jgi:integrase
MNELPELLRAIEDYKGAYSTRRGLRLLLLTCVRTCELRRVTPEQFDLERRSARASASVPATCRYWHRSR